MPPPIPQAWQSVVGEETQKDYYKRLEAFLAEERANHKVFPPEQEVFSALELTPFDQVKVLIVGQDPYHDHNQAHGLAFSVRPGIKPPPSLKNIFKELKEDLGAKVPNNGCLVPWAKQGVLLLNTVLTVRAHKAHSHKGKGWETFTDRIIHQVGTRVEPVVFILWGGPAQKKKKLIDTERHTVLESAHPSPLSARRGFFGSRPFSHTNQVLAETGRGPIDWQLPDL
ncbi:MAG: uracil-DNA glycosylase [Candidatus Competibacteraceae bacterium]|nr:uracil-DNA glycosylase [Candidatus Competibacteraceae bacterium]